MPMGMVLLRVPRLFLIFMIVPLASAGMGLVVPGPCSTGVGPGGCLSWASDDPATGPPQLAVHPIVEAGDRVFAAWGDAEGDVGVRAMDARTGLPLWSARFAPAGNPGEHAPRDIVASADGATVYVAGTLDVDEFFSERDGFVLAFDGATGDLLWSAIESGAQWWTQETNALALTPDEATLLVATRSDSPVIGAIRVSAYDGASGALKWVTDVDGAGSGMSFAIADIAVSPDGAMAYVAGRRVAALDVATGAILWSVPFGPTTRYAAGHLAVSPDGALVAAGGTRYLSFPDDRYDRGVLFEAATGTVVATHEEPGWFVRDVAWTSTGTVAVFAGRLSTWALGPSGLAWSAPNPPTARLLDPMAYDVDARGSTLVVAGVGGDWSLDPATGALRWFVPAEASFPTGITLSRDGARAWASLGDEVRAYVAQLTL